MNNVKYATLSLLLLSLMAFPSINAMDYSDEYYSDEEEGEQVEVVINNDGKTINFDPEVASAINKWKDSNNKEEITFVGTNNNSLVQELKNKMGNTNNNANPSWSDWGWKSFTSFAAKATEKAGKYNFIPEEMKTKKNKIIGATGLTAVILGTSYIVYKKHQKNKLARIEQNKKQQEEKQKLEQEFAQKYDYLISASKEDINATAFINAFAQTISEEQANIEGLFEFITRACENPELFEEIGSELNTLKLTSEQEYLVNLIISKHKSDNPVASYINENDLKEMNTALNK